MDKFITLKLNPNEVEIIIRSLGYAYNEDYGKNDEINKDIINLKLKISKKIKLLIK